MKVSDFIADFLSKKGIKSVFELSGGMITHILDSLRQTTDIHIVTMHHEQAAAFAAEGFARVKGIPGVALATSGPGATNLLTGIGSCYFDSVPAIFITGQVNTHEQKADRPIRQLGFQETDIVSMAKPITKATFLVNDASDIESVFENAFEIAMGGRPGPVLIDIPMNVQREQIEITGNVETIVENFNVDKEMILKLIQAIKNSKAPLILAGHGIRVSRSQELFDSFVEQVKIPVITSLLGLDTIPYDDPLRVGFIGSYGNRWANIAFGECDLLIVLGARLDIRQTGADTKFIENRNIYHIDCESGEINNRVKGCHPIVCDLGLFFKSFASFEHLQKFNLKEDWYRRIDSLKRQWPDTSELSVKGINPNYFVHELSKSSKLAKVFLADVGSHQMWASQSLELQRGQRFLTSGGMGAMGFALPAAIGACLGLHNAPVVVMIGDGCMQINLQELQTIIRNKLNIKIIVFNNQSLGMIRQFQDSYFESRYQSTYWGYSAPNFEKVAQAYDINSKTISSENEIFDALNWLWSSENEESPLLLQVMIEPHTNTYPKIAFGKPITEMEPFSKPIEMEGT
ncbi:thiamine pyrophosphate-binding protein [Sphingobacterium anhuiense]|uniref:thiamine pyrophosphate-binding protein n=1 Tax=Sphingobacterium anhuiense TaxID=493780 RepID=UPI003C2D1107